MRKARGCSPMRSRQRAYACCWGRRRAPSAANRRCEAVELKDGRVLPCGLVVMAVGIRPNTALAATGGLQVKRGIVVDDGMQTSVPGIYAIGECAEHRGTCYGLVEPVLRAGARCCRGDLPASRCAMRARCWRPTSRCRASPCSRPATSRASARRRSCVRDAGVGSYRKLVVREDRLAGVVLVGDTAEALWYRGPDPLSGAGVGAARGARVRPGVRGGGVMSAQDFSDEQKRYLEGFVSGVQASRAAAGLKPLAGVAAVRRSRPGPTPSTSRRMARFEAEGKKLRRRRRPSATSIPSMPTRGSRRRAPKGQYPKGVDNFRWRFHGLFYVAPAQNSYMCRLRVPNGILTHWQLAGVADIAERYCHGYAHVTTRANLQVREIAADNAIAVLEELGRDSAWSPRARVPTTSATSPARPQPASTRRSCSTPDPTRARGITTSSMTARCTACRASSTSASMAAASYRCWRTPTTSPSRRCG